MPILPYFIYILIKLNQFIYYVQYIVGNMD